MVEVGQVLKDGKFNLLLNIYVFFYLFILLKFLGLHDKEYKIHVLFHTLVIRLFLFV